MLVDLDFLAENAALVAGLVAVVLVTNTFINAAILHLLGTGWQRALYAGALLSQIGELSFVLVAAGEHGGIITPYAYQLAIAVISASLLVSPLWIVPFRRVSRPAPAAI